MFEKIRSTTSYKIVGTLSYFAVSLLLLAQFTIKDIILYLLWCFCLLGFVAIYIILGIVQLFEQFRIKQVSTNPAIDVGYILGLAYFIYLAAAIIYNSVNPPSGGLG